MAQLRCGCGRLYSKLLYFSDPDGHICAISTPTQLTLFSGEYQLPLIPPEIGAYMAVTIELSTPVLLALGLMTRLAAFVLLGMPAVIEIFVYPLAWPTHIQWAAMLLVLLCRGAGALSIDHLLWRRFDR